MAQDEHTLAIQVLSLAAYGPPGRDTTIVAPSSSALLRSMRSLTCFLLSECGGGPLGPHSMLESALMPHFHAVNNSCKSLTHQLVDGVVLLAAPCPSSNQLAIQLNTRALEQEAKQAAIQASSRIATAYDSHTYPTALGPSASSAVNPLFLTAEQLDVAEAGTAPSPISAHQPVGQWPVIEVEPAAAASSAATHVLPQGQGPAGALPDPCLLPDAEPRVEGQQLTLPPAQAVGLQPAIPPKPTGQRPSATTLPVKPIQVGLWTPTPSHSSFDIVAFAGTIEAIPFPLPSPSSTFSSSPLATPLPLTPLASPAAPAQTLASQGSSNATHAAAGASPTPWYNMEPEVWTADDATPAAATPADAIHADATPAAAARIQALEVGPAPSGMVMALHRCIDAVYPGSGAVPRLLRVLAKRLAESPLCLRVPYSMSGSQVGVMLAQTAGKRDAGSGSLKQLVPASQGLIRLQQMKRRPDNWVILDVEALRAHPDARDCLTRPSPDAMVLPRPKRLTPQPTEGRLAGSWAEAARQGRDGALSTGNGSEECQGWMDVVSMCPESDTGSDAGWMQVGRRGAVPHLNATLLCDAVQRIYAGDTHIAQLKLILALHLAKDHKIGYAGVPHSMCGTDAGQLEGVRQLVVDAKLRKLRAALEDVNADAVLQTKSMPSRSDFAIILNVSKVKKICW
ncbi:hypothetical protein V8C86DRAFT_2880981 [Haematococcus lacustris]